MIDIDKIEASAELARALLAVALPGVTRTNLHRAVEDDVPALCAELRERRARADVEDAAHAKTMAERDYYADEVARIAALVGCEEEWSNLHAHATCIDEGIAALDGKAERLRARVAELEAVVHLVAEPRHGEPTTADLAHVTCCTCLRRVAAAERELRKAREPRSLKDDDAQRLAAGTRVHLACQALRALGVEP